MWGKERQIMKASLVERGASMPGFAARIVEVFESRSGTGTLVGNRSREDSWKHSIEDKERSMATLERRLFRARK